MALVGSGARAVCSILFASAFMPPLAAQVRLPENLAIGARITAESEYSEDYLARFVADGRVPAGGGKADRKQAWCVQGSTHRDGAILTFQWPGEVSIAEIIYYGRTAWYSAECWKGYEVYVDGARTPVAEGAFEARHGSQRIRLAAPTAARELAIAFTSSHGGPNPGASEVQIFARPVTDEQLERFQRDLSTARSIAEMPKVDQVDPERLRALIEELNAIHGEKYSAAEAHLARLEACRTREDLADLQRDVLLFDVDQVVVIRRHEVVASHVYTYHYEGFRAGGDLCVASPRDPDREPRLLVDSPTGQILDCDLSYDGLTVLFSWRRKEDEGYHLWQVNVDGSGLLQLTDGSWHDYNGCWLPDGGIAFLSTRSAQFAYCWDAPVGVVHRMEADGSGVRQLSANYLNDFTPYPLEDGRILYSRWEYVDRPAIPIQSLWTIRPDGTGLAAYFGNRVLSPGTFMEARPIPGTTRILCTMTGHNGPTRGAIGVIDRALGINAQEAIQNITPDVPVPKVDEGNGNTSGRKQYSCPVPLDARRFLVSIRGPLLVRTIDGECQSLALPAPRDGMQYLGALPLRPRPRPPVIPSRLPSPTEVGEHATVFLQDVYDGLEPLVQRGEIERIRVVRELQKTVRIDPRYRAFGFQFPVISCGATYAGKMVLGEVPLEPDGSAYFRVPAGIPIYFQAIDTEGRAVQRMRSFTHFMPGEAQGCIGCHESRRNSPHVSRAAAQGQSPRDLEPPEWGVCGFDYARIVQPVLDRYCIGCHDAIESPGGIELSGGKTDYFSVSYDVLARENQGPAGSPHVNWIPTYNGQEQNILSIAPRAWGSPRSRLAEIVLSGHPDRDGVPRFNMDENSCRRILAWIDLNVPYYGTSETAHPAAPGCRRIYPAALDAVLADVGRRRCADCHDGGHFPRREWTRITEPHLNSFLLAPLARSAGGSEKCSSACFQTTVDTDYQAILQSFSDSAALLRRRPRMDMEGGKPAAAVCREAR